MTIACFATAPLAYAMRAYPARAFVESVGINTHLRHENTFYEQSFPVVKQRLLAARITHVRDGGMDKDGGYFERDQAARFQELGRAGIRVTFIMRPDVTPEFVRGFPARVSPAFEAYELPNEFNLQQAIPWPSTLREWVPKFRQIVSADAATAPYPIIAPSLADLGNNPFKLLGDQARYVDFGNLHKYYRANNPATAGYGGLGQPPCEAFRYGSLAHAMCHARLVSGDKPIMVTESGYGSNPAAKNQVTPQVQARYISRMLMLHFKAGIRRTFIYQLADSGTDDGGSFGLLNSDGSEKPAFRQLCGLMSEMLDSANAPAAELPVELKGATADVESLLFAKSDGSFRLVLWREVPSFDPKAVQAFDVPAQNVTLGLPSKYRIQKLTTFADSGEPVVNDARKGATPLTLPVTDNLTIVEFRSE